MSINGAINGIVGKARIPANVAVYGGVILVTMFIGWYQIISTIEAVGLQGRINGCQIAEMRLVMQENKAFRNDCFRLVRAWVDGKISDLKPGQ